MSRDEIAGRLRALGLAEKPDLDVGPSHDLAFYGSKGPTERDVDHMLERYQERIGRAPKCFRIDGAGMLTLAGAR